MICLSGFTVRYEGFVMGPLDLTVAAGERVAVVGPNGAGKSTMLRGIAGRLGAYGGRALLSGREVRAAPESVRASVGVLPEALLGFGWMTVREHLALLPAFYPSWDREYADELRAHLEIPPDTILADLSRGNRVKVAFVAAEAFRPPVLILDEPTSGIDPFMRRRILDLVDRSAPRGGGRTVVFSTHILEDLDAIADRIVVLDQGRMVRDSTLRALRNTGDGTALSEIVMGMASDA